LTGLSASTIELSEFQYHRTLREGAIHLWALFGQKRLRTFGCMAARNQVAHGDRCAAAATGFAVHVNFAAGGGVLLDEFDAAPNVFEARRREINCWQIEFVDAGGAVGVERAAVFAARVDDGANAFVL